MASRGVEGCRVGRVGMGCRGVELMSRFGVEVSRPGLSADHGRASPTVEIFLGFSVRRLALGVEIVDRDQRSHEHGAVRLEFFF